MDVGAPVPDYRVLRLKNQFNREESVQCAGHCSSLLHFFRCGSCGRTGQPAPDEKEQIKALLARVELVEKGVAELKVTMVASAAPAARDDVTVGRNNKLETIRICSTVVCPRHSN